MFDEDFFLILKKVLSTLDVWLFYFFLLLHLLLFIVGWQETLKKKEENIFYVRVGSFSVFQIIFFLSL